MVLQQLQALLARLYAVPNEHAVADFLVTDRARFALLDQSVVKQITRDRCSPPDASAVSQCLTDEQVLVSEAADGLRLTVFVDAQVLRRLAADSPMSSLSDSNLSDYCTALEGVSHFHYLTWRAMHAGSVSLLELELQAEVDKYAAAVWLFTAQCGRIPVTLHERMFHRVHFHSGLDAESVARYQAANRCAARFCRELDDRFLRSRRAQPGAWLQEMRKFYRLSHAQKLRRAAA